MASKLEIGKVEQQINEQEWCDSDDDCLDDDQDGYLDDFSRLQGPVDKAGARNEEDDDDDETLDVYHNFSSFTGICLHLALRHNA